jgi:hypothetical protein
LLSIRVQLLAQFFMRRECGCFADGGVQLVIFGDMLGEEEEWWCCFGDFAVCCLLVFPSLSSTCSSH